MENWVGPGNGANMLLLHLLSTIAVQIGFKQDSYAVRESDGTVTVCVNSTTRTFNVPVTLETLDIGTAQGMYS